MPFVAALDRVTVVVVTYHSAHCLPGLDALLSQCRHVVVSDNGSSDGTPEQARQRWPHARVLAHGRNLGFGAANNRALAGVQTPFSLLLNPDCELDANALQALLAAADDWPEAAVLAPQLLDGQGRPEVNYRWPSLCWPPRGAVQAEGPVCVGFVCGAAMLCRRPAFDGVGFFDESFFLYYEDDDLCWRLFSARRPIVVLPQVTAIHRSRGSVKGTRPWRSEYVRGYHHAQSKLHFTAKHRGRARAQRLRWRVWLGTTVALPLRLLVFSPKLVARMWGRWVGLWQWRAHD